MKKILAFLAVSLAALAGFAQSGVFSEQVWLNSGYVMPKIGLGTWAQDDKTAEASVYEAIKCGYRLFDTARYYGNEAGVGRAVRRAIKEGLATREEIFVATKIVPSGGYSVEEFEALIDECNEALALGYIDLMLIHQRGGGERNLYRAIENKIKDGTVRSLGISNYYTAQEFDEITKGALFLPAVVQNENHPFYQNTELQHYVTKYGVYVESYYPFGGRGHTQDLFQNAVVAAIAKAHGKSSAQVLARWHVQAGYIAIPGSSNPAHIRENISIADFELNDEEMAKLAALNTKRRYENW